MRNVRGLSSDARSILVLVATERSGDPGLLRRAADGLGLSQAAIDDAESVLRLGAQITFRHGFVRSAVYALASEATRRDAHLALAEAMDPNADEDRIAWHRAAASVEADETVAADLEASAQKARDRGGHAAAAAVLELAAELTPDPSPAHRQAARRCRSRPRGGRPRQGRDSAGSSDAETARREQRAEAQRLRGTLALARGGDSTSSTLLIEAAKVLTPLDLRKARDTCLDALAGRDIAGRLASDGSMREAMECARSMTPPTPTRTTAAGRSPRRFRNAH